MDDDPQSSRKIPSAHPLPAGGARHHDGEVTTTPHVWDRIRALFNHSRTPDLQHSLEGMIEGHEQSDIFAELTPQARLMLLNIVKFSRCRIDDVMVPRADIIAIDEACSLGELLSQFAQANHSRLPVYRKTLDEPVGMTHIKDLTCWLAARTSKPKSDYDVSRDGRTSARKTSPPTDLSLKTSIRQAGLIREVLFVPTSMVAADLLVKMQSTHNHMAIVVDEYGGTDGLVSIENLVEEIVGDIADEHDEDDPMIRSGGNGIYIAEARAPIEELEALLKVDLLCDDDEEDTDTLGGLIFSMLGRVPARGELIHHKSGVEFEVLKGDPRRLKTIRIHAKAPLTIIPPQPERS